MGNRSKMPDGVTRPIDTKSANQRLPSGPEVIAWGEEIVPGIGNSAITPWGVIRPTFLPSCSVNQMFPSGPFVMASIWLDGIGTGYSAKSWPTAVEAANPVAAAINRTRRRKIQRAAGRDDEASRSGAESVRGGMASSCDSERDPREASDLRAGRGIVLNP